MATAAEPKARRRWALDAELVDALLGTKVLTEEHVAALDEAAGDDIANWPPSRFDGVEGLGPAESYVAAHVVAKFKSDRGIVGASATELPERPPYLDRPSDYDPHDPAQVYEDPQTGELWRWDGKRPFTVNTNLAGQPQPEEVRNRGFDWGQPHRVVEVKHYNVNGVMVPDPQEADRAIGGRFHWFHRGYGVWIGAGGTALAPVPAEKRQAVKVAQQSRPTLGRTTSRPLTA